MSDIYSRSYGYEPAASQLKSLRARAEKAEADAIEWERKYQTAVLAFGELMASRDRLAAYVRANDARVAQEFSPVDLPASIEARQAARIAEKHARDAVDAAGDLEAKP